MNKILSQMTIIAMATTNILTIAVGKAIADTANNSGTDYIFLVTSDWHSCQQIGTAYQEVHAFETPSFYVNICRNGDRFFYSGEAKQGDINSIFLPAYPLSNGRGYQADNGNLSYLILVPEDAEINPKSTEKLLTVERNGKTVLAESALPRTNSCFQLNHSLALNERRELNYNLERATVVRSELDSDTRFEREFSLQPKIIDVNSSFDFSTSVANCTEDRYQD